MTKQIKLLILICFILALTITIGFIYTIKPKPNKTNVPEITPIERAASNKEVIFSPKSDIAPKITDPIPVEHKVEETVDYPTPSEPAGNESGIKEDLPPETVYQETEPSYTPSESEDIKQETTEKTWFFEEEDKDFVPPQPARAK